MSFSYNSFVKFHDKKNLGATARQCCNQIHVITRCVIKGLHCIGMENNSETHLINLDQMSFALQYI